jgi:hypothetical protein
MGRKFEAAALSSSFLLHIRGCCYGIIEFEGTVDPSVRERGDQRDERLELDQVAFLTCC